MGNILAFILPVIEPDLALPPLQQQLELQEVEGLNGRDMLRHAFHWHHDVENDTWIATKI
jgi:hypothetical protein